MENLGTHFGFAAIFGLLLRAIAASPFFGTFISKARPRILNAVSIVVAVLTAIGIETNAEGYSVSDGGIIALTIPGAWVLFDHVGGILGSLIFQQQALWSKSIIGGTQAK